jgi:hypothetical protein
MAEKRTTPEAGAGRRKRAAPTIDLTATEAPAAAAPSEPPSEPPPPADDPPPPAPEQPAPEIEAAPVGEGPPADEPGNSIRPNFSVPIVAAGAAGAAIMTLLLFGLWLTGLVPIRYAGSTATRARVTALEMELRDLQNRPAGAADTKSIDALTQRVAKIEDDIGKIPAADNAMKSLGVAPAALNRRSDDTAANAAQARDRAEAAEKAVTDLRNSVSAAATASAGISSAELGALQKRIAGLEQAAKAAQEEIAKTGAADTAARLALSAAALRDAVVSGAPFAAALAQAKSLGADAKVLAALEPFAASGVPAPAALAQELRALLPGMVKASGAQAPTGGFLERLQANAGQLVRVRPIDAPAGGDASAVLARLEIEAAHANIAGALADLGKLPAATRAPAQGWIAIAQGRQAAIAAAQALAADTARALGSR